MCLGKVYLCRFRGRGIDENYVKKKNWLEKLKGRATDRRRICEDNIKNELER